MTTPPTPGLSDDIAIIGMAGRFPGAGSLDRFWDNLRDGVVSICPLSDELMRQAGVDDSDLADPCYIKMAALLEDADKFDAAFFGYSPREATYIDPQQRVLLECAWEAMEDAGHSARAYPYPVGVYAGSSLNTYLMSTGLMRRLAKDFVLTLSSSDKDFLATRIAYKLNLEGPAITVQSACSTSLVAVHIACQALLDGECDMALAGGVCVKVPQQAGYYWQDGGIVSRDGTVRSFDAAATGTAFGSGAGIVVLRRLADALADADPIRAVIKGSAVNNDGSAKASYTAPSVDKQAEVIVEALARSGIPAGLVSYVEAHGTGTPLGDPIEFAALTKAFRAGTDQTGYCAIGSVKPNIGHLEAAAGIAGLIKTVLALEHETIPPLTNFETPNSACDFAASPFYATSRPRKWPRTRQPRRAGLSALGVGGTNVHVILEEAPRPKPSAPCRGQHLLPVSARTPDALVQAWQRLAEALEGPMTDIPLADIAHTLQSGRTEFEFRAFTVSGSVSDAARQMRVGGRPSWRRASRRPQHTAFYLPSCIAMSAGQEKELSAEHAFRAAAEQVSAEGGHYGSAPHLRTFALEYALARLWMHWGVRPADIIGDGVGDVAASYLARQVTLGEACRRAAGGSFPASASEDGTTMRQRLADLGVTAIVVLGTRADSMPLRELATGDDPQSVLLVDSLSASDQGEPGGMAGHLLAALGALWTAGVPVDWSRRYERERRHLVRLPLYPFQRTRHWFTEHAM